MDITDFEVDQVWVPEHGIKTNNRRIITRIIYMPYNNKQIRHIYYDVPIFCPACETLIRREGQESEDLEDFVNWIRAEDAVCTSDPEHMLNQLRSAKTEINSLKLKISGLENKVAELQNKIDQIEDNDFNQSIESNLQDFD